MSATLKATLRLDTLKYIRTGSLVLSLHFREPHKENCATFRLSCWNPPLTPALDKLILLLTPRNKSTTQYQGCHTRQKTQLQRTDWLNGDQCNRYSVRAQSVSQI